MTTASGPVPDTTDVPLDAANVQRPRAVSVGWVLCSLLVVGVLCLLSVALGARVVGLSDILAGLTGDTSSFGSAAVNERIPRTLVALLVGAALGLAGAAMQAATRNPLADPAILGVSSGASLAVVLGMVGFGLVSPTATIWVAILGAAVASAFVYTIGSMGRGGPTPLKLALAGAATAAALTSLISAILLPRIDVMDKFRFWQIGGVGGAEYEQIVQVLPFLVVGMLVCFGCARGLNSMALGDDVAAGLGVQVGRTRLLALSGAVVLCGAATAIAGPIGFIGLIVPHVARLLVGINQRWALPTSALLGAGLLVAADVVGRVIARPSEVDVGIVTAFIGAPIFIAIVRRQKVRAL